MTMKVYAFIVIVFVGITLRNNEDNIAVIYRVLQVSIAATVCNPYKS